MRELGIHLVELFKPLRVVLEFASDKDSFDYLVVPFVGGTKIIGHIVVEVRNRRREVALADLQNLFGGLREISLVLLSELRDPTLKPAEPNTTPPKNSASFFVSNIFTPRFCVFCLSARTLSGSRLFIFVL